ncbi:zf-UBP-domain-containing protein [Eremomyces bilateralis CBS 781.70]|uniref:Zf-UBP-domain-containing protein n=1 Tax=Eremomyces bilateralis CBS 781.70 TaxID=1392243 RepID=A0A6G1GI31_9PEZI|nr:zf-UBP-domain-containing protein [Eremomyces bilateralis CBS 781.70]KAF1817539.1 zf-UBP-domain-containing protein [Eremomyces bilateralis CBS 781.70]
MPGYFFHIALELYETNAPELPCKSDATVFVPPPTTDIFDSSLPMHGVDSWTARPSLERNRIQIGGDNFGTPSDTEPLEPSTRIESTPHSSVSHHPADVEGLANAKKDWRFGPVTIQSIEMEPLEDRGGRLRGKSFANAGESASDGLSTRGRYVPSNGKDTDVGWGIVHLYRESQATSGLDSKDAATAHTIAQNAKTEGEAGASFDAETCTTLCIVAVPSYMTPSDLLGYLGEETRDAVSQFRLIKTGRANKYMVLMKFRHPKIAKRWQREWNGKAFNSMDPETCHVVFVKSINFQTPGTGRGPSSFPTMTDDPFTPTADSKPTAPLPSGANSSSLISKPLPPPTPSLVELPTCPVCLERMDETSGLLTILCQHVFHCACLEKWRGSGCPVCRYTQNDAVNGRMIGDASDNQCSVCGSTSNLWICLICGNVGCGRYDSAHAFAHYEATSHSFAMDIASQHVWDYVGDGYVHRLVQNKADGKLVDLPAAYPHTSAHANGGMVAMGADTVPREKLDNMGLEYTYLLTSQLDSQRLYFEEQLERAVDKASKAAAAAEKADAAVQSLSEKLAAVTVAGDEDRKAIGSLEKEGLRMSKRVEKGDALARRFEKDWNEEKTMNKALFEKVKFLDHRMKDVTEKCEKLEAEKKDLEEQNRDLSFFISSSEKLRHEGVEEDVKEGFLEVPATQQGGGKRKGRKH